MEKSVRENETKEGYRSDSAMVRELLRLSNSSYNRLLKSPVVNGFSGWDKIQPCAVYDSTPRSTPPPKPTQQKKSYRSVRNQRAKPATAPPSMSYMSGELDENYSYVYTPGVSKRCRREIARNSGSNPATYLPPGPPVVYPPMASAPVQKSQKVFSTVYLDPNISQSPALRQKEAQLQSELARVIKMQMKPELLVEQIIIENRLRAIGGMKSHSNRSLNLEGLGVDPKMIPNLDKGASPLRKKDSQQSRSAPSLLPHPLLPHQQPPKPPSKMKPKKRVKPLLDWCSLHNTEVAAAPGGSLHRTSGAIIASAKREVVSNMRDVLSVKTHSSLKATKAAVPSTRLPSYNVSDDFVAGAGFRLPSLPPQPLGARNHSGNHSQLQTMRPTKLQIT